DEQEREKAVAAGHDPDRVLTTDDLVRGDNIFFVATGITTGDLLRGVRYRAGGAYTQSIVMRSKSGTIRVIDSYHRLEKLARYAVIDFAGARPATSGSHAAVGEAPAGASPTAAWAWCVPATWSAVPAPATGPRCGRRARTRRPGPRPSVRRRSSGRCAGRRRRRARPGTRMRPTRRPSRCPPVPHAPARPARRGRRRARRSSP